MSRTSAPGLTLGPLLTSASIARRLYFPSFLLGPRSGQVDASASRLETGVSSLYGSKLYFSRETNDMPRKETHSVTSTPAGHPTEPIARCRIPSVCGVASVCGVTGTTTESILSAGHRATVLGWSCSFFQVCRRFS